MCACKRFIFYYSGKKFVEFQYLFFEWLNKIASLEE